MRDGRNAGFNILNENGVIEEAACMAHARRKIYDVHRSLPFTHNTRCVGAHRRAV
ncbi:IS66 family transposase [Budvicia aquatica]|uniref:IS66 family transposase n=1 Tax=Budvicia aquatica TaxID=82979 RepID=UPI0034CDAA09